MSLEHPVKALNAEVARKIAAGEVIDRPNAVIRELMDNAIDSGAKNITVEISGGGIEKIRLIDDGCGMTREDLKNCARPHATSKISTEKDLMNLSTLGFRGEALASIAAVSRLCIISGGCKMRASITEDHIIEPASERKGSIVQMEGLFENLPARRLFLKRPATEGLMCKNTFIEKALCRTDISFRFIQDGEIKIDLPAGQSQKERFVMANGYSEDPALFNEVKNQSSHFTDEKPDWDFTVIVGEPAVSRSSKKEIYIYVKGRRIQEYSLVQAIEYGSQGFFPNGTYPVAAAFINVAPGLVDFNIHPAKKEARFYDISDLHHGLSSTLKAFFLKYTRSNFEENRRADEVRTDDSYQPYQNHIIYKPGRHISSGTDSYTAENSYKSGNLFSPSQKSPSAANDFRSRFLTSRVAETASFSYSSKESENQSLNLAEAALLASKGDKESAESFEAESQKKNEKIRFVGSVLGTFLLVEKGSTLFFIDQHALHERIIFDKLMSSQGKNQPLLIPYKIKTDSKTQDRQLEKLSLRLAEIGFKNEKIKDGEWEITSIPERWTGSEYDLRTLLFVKHVEPGEIIRSIAAMTACKAAVKDGYVLDDQTAAELAEKAFDLPDPHCPHGRPVYTTITREELFALVKRT